MHTSLAVKENALSCALQRPLSGFDHGLPPRLPPPQLSPPWPLPPFPFPFTSLMIAW